MTDSKKASWARIGALAALWVTVSAGAIAAPGCYGRNCEGKAELFSADVNGGMMTDDNTWYSSDMLGEWLPFPRQRTWVFDVPALGGRVPAPTAYLSASPNQKNGGDFVDSSGNLAKFTTIRPNGVNVYNDTCSDYYILLVLRAPALPPKVTPPDDEPEPDASVPGASTDDDAGDGG